MPANFYQGWIKPISKDISTFILDTLFPIHCIVCEKEGKFVCGECLVKLAPVENQVCIMCKKPSAFGMTHVGCRTAHGADGLISFLDYHDENVSQILITGKYSFLPGLYKELGEWLAAKLSSFYPSLFTDEDTVYACPIPLHRNRRRWRGFNQSEVLCQTMGKFLPVVMFDALERSKATKTQKDLKREERIKNMESAFRLKPRTDVHGKTIILVDDVTTTGSTLLEAAKVLKRNGAEKVWCLTLARD